VKLFDDDVMSRFIWAGKAPPNDAANVLGFNVDWERYAGFQNLFPRAVKVLLMPNFVFTGEAKQDKPIEMSWRRPPSLSPYDQIMWRISRLKLNVLELGYQPMPNRKTPPKVKRRLTSLLEPFVEALVPKQGTRQVIRTEATRAKPLPPRKRKFGQTVMEKRQGYLSKKGFEPPKGR